METEIEKDEIYQNNWEDSFIPEPSEKDKEVRMCVVKPWSSC